jgi:ATP-dependent protease ClpP protease subunit
MHKNRLLNLLRNNAKRGEFKAEGNTIYLYDVIVSSKEEADWFGGVDAETFVQTMKGMKGDISLRVNCPGGDVFAARAMAQAIREHDGTVTAHVDGYAASAASFVTSVADKTVMGPGSMLMIHKAWSLALGNADDMMATASLLEKIDGTIVETYEAAAKSRGKDVSDFAGLMSRETWLTGVEAIDLGLADEVAEASPKNAAKWDLSAYDNAPETTLTVKVELDAGAEQKLADLSVACAQAEHLTKVIQEIEETARPNFAADMLLRPAA